MPTSRSWAPTTWAREPLLDTANLLGIAAASPNTAAQLKKSLPQSSYGQGQVVASPFQMARVAATVANGGAMPQGPLDHRRDQHPHQRRRRPVLGAGRRRRRWANSCAKW